MKKALRILTPVLLVLIIIFVAPSYEARADDGDEVDETTGAFNYEEISGLNEAVLRMLDFISTPSETVATWMKIGVMTTRGSDGTDEETVEETVLNYVNEVFKYFQVFGMCLLVIYFLMDYSRTTLMQGQDFTLKSMAVSFLKLGAGWIVLSFGAEIVSALFDMNNGIMDDFVNRFSGTDNSAYINGRKMMFEQVKEFGVLECIGAIPNLLIAEIGAVLGNCIILYQAISRKIEVYVRTAFVPLAIGDCYNGENSVGVRYLKKLFAVCLWGLGMMLVVGISSSLSANYITSTFSQPGFSITDLSIMLKVVLFPLAAGGMCSGIKQICCEALGC